MKTKLFLIFALILKVHFSTAQTRELHDYYKQMKAMRTYYVLNDVSDLQYHFTVWFRMKGEVAHCSVAVRTLDEMKKLTKKDTFCMIGAFSIRPPTIPVIPNELKEYSSVLENYIEKEYGSQKDVAVGFFGRHHLVTVSEIIPLTLDATKSDWGITRKIAFATSEKFEALDIAMTGEPGGTGLGGLCPNFRNPTQCKEKPNVLRFEVSKGLQGSSIFTAQFPLQKYPTINPRYKAEWKNLSKALLKAAKEIFEKKFKDEFADLNKELGNEAVPKEYKNFVTGTYSYYATLRKKEKKTGTIYEDVSVAIEMEPAKETLEARHEFKDVGIKIHSVLDLKKGEWTTTAKDATNNEQNITLQLNRNPITLKDNGREYYILFGFDTKVKPRPIDYSTLRFNLSEDASNKYSSVSLSVATSFSAAFVFP